MNTRDDEISDAARVALAAVNDGYRPAWRHLSKILTPRWGEPAQAAKPVDRFEHPSLGRRLPGMYDPRWNNWFPKGPKGPSGRGGA